jgi:hypothetical protein
MSTHPQPPPQPEIPAELWMLWDFGEGDRAQGDWAHGNNPESLGGDYAVFLTNTAAHNEAVYRHKTTGARVRPVRVK